MGKCEEKLRKEYNINNNISIFIFQIEFFTQGILIPIIEYEVYDIIKRQKLDLNYCNDIEIDISIPVSIDEDNLFKYNSSNEYYNDKCFPYTTENDTDIIIEDRRNEYINNNLSLFKVIVNIMDMI